MSHFGVHLVCDVWDLLDEGIYEVLDRAQGELGVTGITVPAVSPPVNRLRCHLGVSPRLMRSSGGAFFHANEAEYTATRCKPVAAVRLKSADPLNRVADGCRSRGLECRAVVYATSAGQVVGRYPQTAAKSALGDAWPDRLCLVNPDVGAMLAAICRDLTANVDLTGVVLADVHIGRSDHLPGRVTLPFDVGSRGRALLSMCFCESCRQLPLTDAPDGLDAAAAARSAEVRLEKILETGRPLTGAVAGLFEEDAVLASYAAAQWSSAGRVVQAASDACEGRLTLLTYSDAVPGRADWPWAGDESAPTVAGLARYGGGPDQADKATRAARSVGDDVVPEVWLGTGGLGGLGDEGGDSSWWVRHLSGLAEAGVACVTLDNYGCLPRSAMAGVKQAIRFARRSG